MQEDQNQNVNVDASTPRWVGIAIVVLTAVSLVGLGFGWSAAQRAQAAEQALAVQAQAVKQVDSTVSNRIEKTESTNAQLQADLSAVNDKLKKAETDLRSTRGQTKKIREDYTKSIEEVQASVRNELAGKASADEVNAKVGALGTDINGVRSDLESAKRDLGMTRGEFGTLIARNHEDIEKLRRLGEREYFEFTLDRKGSQEKLQNVTVELRGTNTKKKYFTVALYVDDLRLEKKNRSINEPIYFYTQGSRQALELVVNRVDKNKITGYLSVPKGASGNAVASKYSFPRKHLPWVAQSAEGGSEDDPPFAYFDGIPALSDPRRIRIALRTSCLWTKPEGTARIALPISWGLVGKEVREGWDEQASFDLRSRFTVRCHVLRCRGQSRQGRFLDRLDYGHPLQRKG